MLKQIKRKNEGFTIIEVLIVLAIAGLIMVIVFLAVPALNRNAHNQQYKTEANNLLAAYQELSNNQGGAALTSSDASTLQTYANTKRISTVTIQTTTNTTTPPLGTAVIVTGQICTPPNPNTYATTTTGATPRSVALVFALEAPNNGTTPQCVGTT